jgi:hypothetical protein
MSYASITVADGLTMADYRAVTDQLGPQPGEGLLIEAAGWNDAGLHVITVWESKTHHEQFVTDRLVPAFHAAGVHPGPITFTDLADAVYQHVGETANP